MSYSNPHTISHHTGVITTTDAAVTIPISGPKGMKGRLIDIIADAVPAALAVATR